MNDSTSTSVGPSAQRLIDVREPADVGEARRQAAEMARILVFDPTPAGNLALGVTEAAMNIVKHAREGVVLLRALHDDAVPVIEVLAVDAGAGMTNVGECLRDGYSTAGSPGTGLGALSRLSEAFQIVSHPGKGTALRFEIPARPLHDRHPGPLAVGAVSVPKRGEIACGDGWTLLRQHAAHALLVVDGLGHGVAAAAAAHAAIDLALRYGENLSATELIETLHAGLRTTRGAAGAAIVLDPQAERGSLCGIGNIAVSVHHAGKARKLVSHNGILGHQKRRVQAFGFAFPPGALVIAHSDGLDTHWRLGDYAGLESAHPALIAGVLFRHHERRRDDSTVVVVRNEMGAEMGAAT